MSKVFFFKEFGTHSFNFINLDKDSFRFIQLHSSSSFNSLLQNIPFYNYCATCRIWAINMHNFPQYCVIQQRKNTDGKRNNRKVAPNKPELTLLFVFFFFFSSSKSLSTPDFFLMVIKNTLMVSQWHSLDLE